ncbi:Gfo/Idh/MocA family oxidoreductase [Myxococcota bacterium]|nr:Gfo/Idh/MocA family oxidoreductase [Myxococcota bacterium]
MRSSDTPVRVGLIGSGWITRVHAQALRAIPEATIVASADYPRDRGGRAGRGEALATELGIPRYFADYRAMLEDPSVEAVTVALPNALHGEVALAALRAGKHVMIEKPLCLSLAEADAIVALAEERGLVAAYAEELCYCPKYVRGRELVASGVIGKLFWVKQVEAHAGPYSDWFFDPALAGGGAVMDMGCHAIEWARWMFDKSPVRRVTAKMGTWLHGDRATPRGLVEDQCVIHLELDDGRAALVEAGWTLHGGMDSIAHLQGTEGVLKIDLLSGTGMELFSMKGHAGHEVPPGWSTPSIEWLRDNGYPQEMADFARAIRTGAPVVESAADGRAVLEIIWAAYASAALGRTIELPYAPPAGIELPVELWIRRDELCAEAER